MIPDKMLDFLANYGLGVVVMFIVMYVLSKTTSYLLKDALTNRDKTGEIVMNNTIAINKLSETLQVQQKVSEDHTRYLRAIHSNTKKTLERLQDQ